MRWIAVTIESAEEEGTEVDPLANSGVTALWLASGEGRADVMKALLKKDANPNNARSDNISALMAAAVGGHADAVKLLLDNGANSRVSRPVMSQSTMGVVWRMGRRSKPTDL